MSSSQRQRDWLDPRLLALMHLRFLGPVHVTGQHGPRQLAGAWQRILLDAALARAYLPAPAERLARSAATALPAEGNADTAHVCGPAAAMHRTQQAGLLLAAAGIALITA